MRPVAAPYVCLFLVAPLMGVGVSRIASSFDGNVEVRPRCVSPEVKLSPLGQTSIMPPPKLSKRFTAAWRPSKRRGMQNVVTTLYSVHLKEAVPILKHQRPPDKVLNHFYRCRGFGTEHPLDPRLTDAAVDAALHFKAARVEVISAYRSPKFNDALSKKGRHVAAESKHTKGMAMDIRIVGTPANTVGKWLFEHFEGGVGTYVSDDFVHIDTGAKRRWRGR